MNECFFNVSLLMLVLSIILTIVLYFLANPIAILLGAKGETLIYTTKYIKVIILGTIFQLLATGFTPFIRNMGGSLFVMISMILGFITNIILDYIFVWVLNLGMVGAALATIIGQLVTLIFAIIYFIKKKCKLDFSSLKNNILKEWGKILKVALSPFSLTFSPTITMLLMNKFLLIFGNEQDVAIYGCIGYVVSIVYLLVQGVGDGSQPLISQYYGEKDNKEVNSTCLKAYLLSGIITILSIIVIFVLRDKIGISFGSSNETNQGVIKYIIYFLLTLIFVAFTRITTSYLYATKNIFIIYISLF